MKNNLHLWASKRLLKSLFPVILLIFLLNLNNAHAQVNFTQTTDADFNRGVLNSTLVSGDNAYLQNAASDVGTWLTATSLPQSLSGHKTVTWNNRFVYLIGGMTTSGYSNAVYVATIYPGGTSGWYSLNSLPVGLKDPAVVIGTNTIYVIGGRNATQVFNTVYYASLNYDGTIGTWQTSVTTLPSALWGHTGAYVNGYIYIIGGSAANTENTALNTVWYAKVKADNTLSTFNAGTNLPAERNKHSMVTYNGKLYILGGYNNSGTKSANISYATTGVDGSLGAWSDGGSMPVEVSNHSTVLANGLVMVLAGSTNAGLSNTVYYANIDQPFPWIWTTSSHILYDFTKDGAAYAINGLVVHTGGSNLSGAPILNSRYATLTMTSNYLNHGTFVSIPFYELGADRIIDSLTFHASYNPLFANCQVSYRTAHIDGNWTNWTTLTTASPILVNDTTQYLQYSVCLSGQNTYNTVFQDMTISTRGSQLSGDLSATPTFTKAKSPYWVTSDISFNWGTHTFEAGATILFMPQTGMYVGQANIICSGNAVDSVKFKYYAEGIGFWKGIRFQSNSDEGVSSQFYYTMIEGAGFGDNNANLTCDQTNEPYLLNCNFRYADGVGLNLMNSNIIIQNTIINSNTEGGVWLNNGSPTFVSCSISNNGGYGVGYNSTTSNPTYSSTIIDHNLYGIYFPSPNFSFSQPLGSPTLTENTYNGIAMAGGTINNSNCIWSRVTYDYILLGTVNIVQWYGNVRLTIEPGNTIKALSGVRIYIGKWNEGYPNYGGGELYALGTSNNLITFTSFNGQPGGWEGLYFTPQSDDWGGHSQMDYCVIEKGNEFNYFAEATIQPDQVNHCIIQNALMDGARYSSSSGMISNCQFLNNGRYPLYLMGTGAAPQFTTTNSYLGNGINEIALSGGDFAENKVLYCPGIPYHVLGDIRIRWIQSNPRITIKPGVTLAFEPGKKIQVGAYEYIPNYGTYGCGGELYAEGKADSIITFKPYNDSVGGWGGVYFHEYNDNYGGTSKMKYCKVAKAANYNLICASSNQPQLNHCEFTQSSGIGIQLNSSSLIIDSCTISNSGSHGLLEQSSSAQIHHCQFTNNNGYPLIYWDWYCNSNLFENIYSGNAPNYIGLSGGDYSESRTFYNDGIPYHVLGDIRIKWIQSNPRITIKPGVTLAFETGKKIQVGAYEFIPNYGTYGCGGELYAEGKADSIITFKPYNDSVGGWGGVYFHDFNDNYGGTSSMKYCKVEKAANYNLICSSSNQPQLNHCEFTQSSGIGIQLNSSSLLIDSCTIRNSGSHGLLEQSSSAQIHHCQFTNNNGYPLIYWDWPCNSHLFGNIYSGNTPNYIGLSGGDYSESRTFYNDGIPYHVLGDIRIKWIQSNPRITVKPGVILAFESGKKIQVGAYEYIPNYGTYGCGGELYAEGKADSVITFKPYNDSVGGWGGVYFHDYNDNYGGTSKMKYCKVEKANADNLFCYSSYQPLIEHCQFSQSSGDGIGLVNSALTIRNTSIFNNTLQGIYNEGSNPPSIGNSPQYSCNIYYNGGYNIYNNSTTNISARNNFWASRDSIAIKGHIYDKDDNGSLGHVYIKPFIELPYIENDSMIISGGVNYANSVSSSMNNTKMKLIESGILVDSTATNSSGEYSFAPVPTLGYNLNSIPVQTWGGVNATDALLILNHTVHISTLTGIKLAAADMNLSSTVNATDALYAMNRFTGNISSFPSGDLFMEIDTVIVDISHVTYNLKMLWFGDVNGSYFPTSKKAGTSVSLAVGGLMEVPSFTEFNLPITIKKSAEVGAISFGFFYPEEFFEITGVTMAENRNNFIHSAKNGLFRFAWSDLNPVSPKDEEMIVTVKMRSQDLSGLMDGFTFGLYDESEFADRLGQVIPDVILDIPGIKSKTYGIDDPDMQFFLNVHPNPFRDFTTIDFTLNTESSVTVNLCDLFGKIVKSIEATSYLAGSHRVLIKRDNIAPGIYLLKVDIVAHGKVSSKIIKVVVSK